MAQPDGPDDQHALPARDERRELALRERELQIQERTLEEQARGRETYEKAQALERRTKIATTAIQSTGRAFWPAALIYTISRFAGHETKLLVEIIAKIGDSVFSTTGWVVAILLGLGWYVDWKSKRRTIAEYAARNAILEKIRDPNRDSSELTPSGDTNPRDKV